MSFDDIRAAQVPAPSGGVRGYMLNIDILKGIRFALNPNQISHEKYPKYEYEMVPGWPAPIVRYIANGEYRIKFDMFFDESRDTISHDLVLYLTPMVGTQGVKAILETFMLPEMKSDNRIPVENPFTKDPPPRKFIAPPDCFLILGTRWWRTKLVAAPMQEIKFDGWFTPTRMLSQLEFVVIEEGTLHDVMALTRQIYSFANTARDLVSAFTNLIGGNFF